MKKLLFYLTTLVFIVGVNVSCMEKKDEELFEENIAKIKENLGKEKTEEFKAALKRKKAEMYYEMGLNATSPEAAVQYYKNAAELGHSHAKNELKDFLDLIEKISEDKNLSLPEEERAAVYSEMARDAKLIWPEKSAEYSKEAAKIEAQIKEDKKKANPQEN